MSDGGIKAIDWPNNRYVKSMEEQPLILITGANGQLGQAFRFLQGAYKDAELIFMDRAQLDITNAKQCRKVLETLLPDIVINCAAYTNVEKAEEEVDLAMLQNGTAPAFLAVACSLTDTRLIHFSTDYVFDGSASKAYLENDPTGPLSSYGQSKLAGERGVISAGGDFWIFRIAWLYSPFGHNFYKTMLRLANEKPELSVVSDQFGSPTNALVLASDILKTCSKTLHDETFELPAGVYHYAHQGQTSWYGFATEILRQNGIKTPVLAVDSEAYPTKAKRPKSSILDASLFYHSVGIEPITWEQALTECNEINAQIQTQYT